MALKIENTIVDQKEIIPIVEERLGDISQIKTKYEVIIMPNKAQAEGDILNRNTAIIRNSFKKEGIKVGVAVREPHKYIGQYSNDIVLPTLIFIGTNIGLNIIANFIYDRYFKNNNTSDTIIHLEYIELNYESDILKKTMMEGPVSDVIKALETVKDK